MKINGNQTHLNDLLTNYLNDHRASNTPKARQTKQWTKKPKRIIDPINGIARFKLIIYFKNRPNDQIWIPSLDFNKGRQGNYHKNEKDAYEKLIYLINIKYDSKFTFCYIMMSLENKPLWEDEKYNYCVYANFKGEERNYFKNQKIFTFGWKDVNLPNGRITQIINRSSFLSKYANIN